jgi:dihydrofolate synthase/folylpolyglutamate synthase
LRELGFKLPRRAIVTGLEKVRWPARLERIRGKPAHLLDAAHNPDGAAALAEYLRVQPERPRVLVFGVMQDKDYPAMLRSLAPEVDAIFYASPRLPRAEQPSELAKVVPGVVARSIPDALRRAKRSAGRSGLVVVAGSIFLVAEARAKLLGVSTDPLIRM